MKIICIGRNYADHAKELNNAIPDEPVIFMKPDTALLPEGKPFFIPEFTKDVHHELELVVRINRVGKYIEPEFAHKYYAEIGLGIDFTARDIQLDCKSKGLPWEKAKAFDGSAPIGSFVNKEEVDLTNATLKLEKNGEVVQEGNTKDMLFPIDEIIAQVSKYVTLKVGDLIYTGTPAGVSPVKPGDELVGYLNNQVLLRVSVK
jgi:2-keto-4-pentenoate hydratase/2-oxohepta-3-ene-1,7-dioic acid hydratase in catechol pathway